MSWHADQPGRVVVACGGFRSGSTLQYNLIGEYVERLRAGRRIGYVTPPQSVRLLELPSIVDAIGLSVAKSHDLASGFREWGGTDGAWREWYREGRLVPVYCVRDFRDVIASMSRKFQLKPAQVTASPEWRENVANMNAWLELSPLVQRYEDLVARPQATLGGLARHLGLPFRRTVARQAAKGASLGQMRRVTAGLPRSTWDARTLVHWDHIASPDGGQWRNWAESERTAVERELKPLMARFGYAS